MLCCSSFLLSSEICAVSRHSKKEIGRCFKLIRQATNTQMSTVSTSDFMVTGRGRRDRGREREGEREREKERERERERERE